MAPRKSHRTQQSNSANALLPKPRRIKLSNGKTRTIYYDFEGRFISKAQYEELRAKSDKPSRARKQITSKTNLQAKQSISHRTKRTSQRIKRTSQTKSPAISSAGATVLVPYEQPVLSLAEHSIVPPSISPSAILFTEKTPLTLHGPGPTRISEMGIQGQEYQVVAIDPTATSSSFVDLWPDQQYYLVPIKDETQTSSVQQRFILVKEIITTAADNPFQPTQIVVAILRPNVTGDQLMLEKDTNILTSRVQAQEVDINRLRAEISLPSLIRIDQFSETVTRTLENIDFFYSTLALVYRESTETLDRFVSFLQSQKDVTKITSSQVYSFATQNSIEPLRLVSAHYGSNGDLRLEGLPPIIKNVLEIFQTFILLKPQKQKLELEVVRQRLDILMSGIETVRSSKLTDEQKDPILDTWVRRVVMLTEANTLPQSKSLQITEAKLTDFHDIDWHGKQMAGAQFGGYSFRRANMTMINLSNANLTKANFQDADLSLAELSDAQMSEASLANANLRNANLQRVDLHSAQAMGASFENANLRRANLRDANLSLANLQKADLLFADLTGIDFTGADLHDAKVTDEQLHLARSLSGATMRNGSIHS